MASPAKADSASGGANPPDALQLAAAAADNPGLTVNTGTGSFAADPAVTPPTPSTDGTRAIVVDDSDDVPVPVPSTFSCQVDIKALELHTKGKNILLSKSWSGTSLYEARSDPEVDG